MIVSGSHHIAYEMRMYRCSHHLQAADSVLRGDQGWYIARGLQIYPERALAALHVEACTSPAHTVLSPRKCTKSSHVVHAKFINSFKRRKKDIDHFLTVPIMYDKRKIRMSVNTLE